MQTLVLLVRLKRVLRAYTEAEDRDCAHVCMSFESDGEVPRYIHGPIVTRNALKGSVCRLREVSSTHSRTGRECISCS